MKATIWVMLLIVVLVLLFDFSSYNTEVDQASEVSNIPAGIIRILDPYTPFIWSWR